MRWRTAPHPTDYRFFWHDHFAWFPVEVYREGKETVWLEWVRRKGEWVQTDRAGAWWSWVYKLDNPG